mmetsp:Transcript_63346/g.185186  ORF Transcript_63346/g.185186 Transcript_63346/m.185186 type:complete len:300 (+) Transcript_63346:53-952(+)
MDSPHGPSYAELGRGTQGIRENTDDSSDASSVTTVTSVSDAAGSGSLAKGSRHSHRVPWVQYFAFGVWTLLLLLQYGFTRALCHHGIPKDCEEMDRGSINVQVRVMYDFQQLLTMGFVLAVLTGVHLPERFFYIFRLQRPRPRGLVFLLCFFLSSPGWSALNANPTLSHFTLTADMKGIYLVLLGFLLLLVVLLVGWHLWCAWRHNSWKGFLAYLLSRLAVWTFYAVYMTITLKNKRMTFRIHHYEVAYLAAVLAEFNHPLSLLLLAIGTGIFVQGIAAYSAVPIVGEVGLYAGTLCFG